MKATDVIGHEETYDYSGTYGQVTAFIDALGKRTTYDYGDGSGDYFELEKVTFPGNGNQSLPYLNFDYTSLSLLSSVKENNDANRETTLNWDAISRLTGITLPEVGGVSFQTDITYDTTTVSGATVDRVKVSDVNDNETRYVSNTRALLGQVEIEQGGDDNETGFSYDGSENLTEIADEAGNETQYAYTAFNELSKVARANTTLDDPTAQYVYDSGGNMTCAEDAKGQVVSFEYDTLNRLVKKSYRDGSSCASLGTEVRKVEVSYAGSRLQEVKETRISGSKVLSKLSYDYDDSYRLASVREMVMTDITNGTTVGRTMEYDYNARDQVTLVTPSSGDSLAYSYYDDGSMNEVRLAGTKVAKYEYDAQRMRSKVTRYQSGGTSTATTTDYSYDYQDRLTAIEHKDASAARITKYEYDYDDGPNGKGLRTGQTRTLAGATVDEVEYEYDSMYRLTAAGLWDGSTQRYAYDELGNMTEVRKVDGGANQEIEIYILYGGTSPHAGMNRLAAVWHDMNGDGDTVDSGDYKVGMGYDANGNMTARDVTYPNGGGTNEAWDYAYDADDRLITAIQDDDTIAEYSYDPFGRRTIKKTGGNTDVFFYDREDILQVKRGATTIKSMAHGPGIDDYIGIKDQAGNISYLLTDGLGSITERTNQTGTLRWRAQYSPFGSPSLLTDPDSRGLEGYGYTGREYDSETALMFYRSRYYSVDNRRFIQEDEWMGILTIPSSFNNRFMYVGDDPFNFIDPLGSSRFRLPKHPMQLGPEWRPDLTYHNPNIRSERHRNDVTGDTLRYDRGDPEKSSKTPGGKDHWHFNDEKTHLYPDQYVDLSDPSLMNYMACEVGNYIFEKNNEDAVREYLQQQEFITGRYALCCTYSDFGYQTDTLYMPFFVESVPTMPNFTFVGIYAGPYVLVY